MTTTTTTTNPNHPLRGSSIRVYPLTSTLDIAKVKMVLKDNPRDLALFTVGINTSLRAQDLLRLRVGDVLVAADPTVHIHELYVVEHKTGVTKTVVFNDSCLEAIRNLLDNRDYPSMDSYIFGNPRTHLPLTIPAFSRLVKSWCKRAGIPGHYAARTLRKTWGRMQYSHFHTPLPLVSEALHHSGREDTMRYLNIPPDTPKNIYKNTL